MIKKLIKKMNPELTGNGIGAIIGSTIPGISGALAGVIDGKAVEKFINRYKADNVTSNFNPSNEFKKVKFDISQTLKEIIEIDIEGFINSDSSWLKTVCEELILILHLDENFPPKVIPLCMQSERYLYKSSSTNNQVNILIIPFDKINYFSNYEKV